MGLDYDAPTEQIPTGLPRLDAMLGGGLYRGSSILVADGRHGQDQHCGPLCRRDLQAWRALPLFAFEESRKQIMRNMRSIGIDLAPWSKKVCCTSTNVRPSVYVLEMHLVMMHKLIKEFKPGVVIVDPISNLLTIGKPPEVKSVLTRLIDFMKMDATTALFTSLLTAAMMIQQSASPLSWIPGSCSVMPRPMGSATGGCISSNLAVSLIRTRCASSF